MKFTLLLTAISSSMISCSKPKASATTSPAKMPWSEIAVCLAEFLPQEASDVVLKDKDSKKHRIKLTVEEFERLKFEFVNELYDRASKSYGLGSRSHQSTTYSEGDSSFSVSMGGKESYDFVIIGTHSPENDNTATIWIKSFHTR